MKSLIVGLALFIGTVGIANAGGRQNQGWMVTICTGNATTINEGGGRTFLKSIKLSSASTASLGDYLIAITTRPSLGVNGADASSLMGGNLFLSTTQITTALVFKTSTTLSGVSDQLNNMWTAGDAEDDFIEIPGDRGLHIRQTSQASGEAFKASVMWSK